MSRLSADDKKAAASLQDEILREALAYSALDDAPFFDELSKIVTRKLFGTGSTAAERLQLIRLMYNRTRGLDILQPLMDNRAVTEIMVNGPDRIFYEEEGFIRQSELRFDSVEHLTDVIHTLFARLNRPLSLRQPIADGRMKDGSRDNAVLPPIAPDGPILTMRKFTGVRHTPEALVETGFITSEALTFLHRQVSDQKSIFICGGTGTGKTTLLNVLSSYIPARERIVTIEDSAELQLVNQPNLVRLETRLPGPDGDGEITISNLIRTALRMRPDRIIVGEVRGAEAADLIHAMNTGHPGSLCTGHGNSCRDMLVRLCNLVLEGSALPLEAIRQTLAQVIDFLVHIRRMSDGRRRIDEICRVDAGSSGQPLVETLYLWNEEAERLEAQT